jgi:serine/threonine-protein kinase
VGSTLGGGYVLEATLGGMCSVFRARRSDGLVVAIKVLHGEALERWDLRRRLEREASALAAMMHPNVIGVHELGEVDAVPTLASVRPELVPRPELEHLIRRALAKSPADRFADAGEMRAFLARVPRPVATLSAGA